MQGGSHPRPVTDRRQVIDRKHGSHPAVRPSRPSLSSPCPCHTPPSPMPHPGQSAPRSAMATVISPMTSMKVRATPYITPSTKPDPYRTGPDGQPIVGCHRFDNSQRTTAAGEHGTNPHDHHRAVDSTRMNEARTMTDGWLRARDSREVNQGAGLGCVHREVRGGRHRRCRVSTDGAGGSCGKTKPVVADRRRLTGPSGATGLRAMRRIRGRLSGATPHRALHTARATPRSIPTQGTKIE